MPSSQLSGAIDLGSVLTGKGFLFRRYFGAAEALWPGLEHLAGAELDREDAYFLVAGFCAEVLLKSLQAHHTELDAEPRQDMIRGHDLCHLWSEAAVLKLVDPVDPPNWLSALNVFHGAPYFIRYHEPGGLYSLPRRGDTHLGLGDLMGHTRAKLFPTSEA